MKKKGMPKGLLIVGFLLGLGILLYPFLSQLYYDYAITSEVDDFQEAVANYDPPELKDEKVELAEAFNEALEPDLVWEDPYSEEKREEGMQEYANMLEVQEKIGVVKIPTINVSLPIYAGTSESVLQKAVGHLEGTSLPVGGENTHSVITAHRGLPEARLFTDLDKMEEEDIFSVETLAGEIFYEVDQITVVEPTDIDSIRITEGQDYMTLLTCTPYMINSHRLLVRGHRIPAPEEEDLEKIEKQNQLLYYLQTYWYYYVLIILTLLLVFFISKKAKKNNRN